MTDTPQESAPWTDNAFPPSVYRNAERDGWAHAIDHARRLEVLLRQCVEALEHTRDNLDRSLQGKPIRDATETLGEARSALTAFRKMEEEMKR